METSTAERVLKIIDSATGKALPLDTHIELESLEFLELVKDIESEFSIQIPDHEFIGLNTPREFVACVTSHLSARVG